MSDSSTTNGFTLVEVVIATTLLTAIFGAAFTVVVSGSRTVEDGITETELHESLRGVLDRMTADVRSARVEPLLSPSILRFRKLHGSYDDGFGDFDFDTAEIQWDGIPVMRYEWSVDPGETRNDIDDDGDGLIDEGRLSRVANGTSIVLSHHVPENGFTVTLEDDDRLTIVLTLEMIGREGRIIRETETKRIYLRN